MEHFHFWVLEIIETLIWRLYRADSAAVAITTTDLVSKSVAIEAEVFHCKSVSKCFSNVVLYEYLSASFFECIRATDCS